MNCIQLQNYSISEPTRFNKGVIGVTLTVAIMVFALSLIGLIATAAGPLQALVQFGEPTHLTLLAISTVVLALDLVWIMALCKKRIELAAQKEENPVDHADVVHKEENPVDHSATLPNELLVHVFSYLSIKELATCSRVSKHWKELASDQSLWNMSTLRRLFPTLNTFVEADWRSEVNLSAYGLELDDIDPLNKDVFKEYFIELKKFITIPVEGSPGVTAILLTMPKGLSRRKLIEIASAPKAGRHAVKFVIEYCSGLDHLNTKEVPESYRVLITNGLIQNSLNMSSRERKDITKQYNCVAPDAIEAATLFAVTFMRSGKYLLTERESDVTYTACSERIEQIEVIVGIHTTLSTIEIKRYHYNDSQPVTGVMGAYDKFTA